MHRWRVVDLGPNLVERQRGDSSGVFPLLPRDVTHQSANVFLHLCHVLCHVAVSELRVLVVVHLLCYGVVVAGLFELAYERCSR